ncbi:MAG: hypothetical protein PVI43_01790 [Candidatus Bathyarchaeota archaeon]|jgi:hypothetical protein
MKPKWLILIILLLTAIFSVIAYNHYNSETEVSEEDFFFGVSFGGKTSSEAKQLIDRVKGYTNLFLINSWDITINETALNEVCEYASEADLDFMVFFDFISHTGYPWHLTGWLDTAKERWENHFLGVYLYDEPGGRQIVSGQWDEGIAPRNSSTYGEAAEFFVTSITSTWSMRDLKSRDIPVFTSDFALYWFDYLAGYDAVFVEFGWNHSRPQQVALGRGAANVQNKEWGAIITWTFQQPPYLESGTRLLEDLQTAYQAGAKYLIVFNYPTYPQDNPYGILAEEHFDAMETFWNMTTSPESYLEMVETEAAFVLPKDYGWGMRRPDDNIWFPEWGPDNKSALIWENMNKLITTFGLKLDIIYDDPRFSYEETYPNIYLWNDQID